MKQITLRRVGLAVIVSLMLATPSWAEGQEPDYGRSGFYVGIGAGAAWDFLDSAIEDVTLGAVEIGTGGTFNARAGYRILSWLAVEAMYEGIYGLNTDILGVESGSSEFHSFLFNVKLIAPIWRIHPYMTIGPGVQYGKFNGKGLLDVIDTDRTDFTLRLGFGVDGYITENWVANVEIAPSIRFREFNNIPSEVTDNVSMTLSFGVGYRF